VVKQKKILPHYSKMNDIESEEDSDNTPLIIVSILSLEFYV